MNKIAGFIKTERKAANLTQEQFAEISGIGLHTLRDLEQGKDNITLYKINQALAMLVWKLYRVESGMIKNATEKQLASR